MAFENLSEKLQGTFKKLKGKGVLTEADINDAMREVKLALLEADVNFKVVKEFVAEVKEKALGQGVLESLTPGQQVIKIVNDTLVDLMGGVTFDLPVDMHYSDPTQNLSIDLQAGKQHLNGEQAMQVARFRSGYATADLGRIEVQRALVSAAIRQWVSPKGAIHLPQAVKLVADHTNTDLSTRNLLWLAESFLLCSRSDIRSATLPGYAANFSSGSYYVLDAAGVADIVNQYLNPYEKGVEAADLFIRNG